MSEKNRKSDPGLLALKNQALDCYSHRDFIKAIQHFQKLVDQDPKEYENVLYLARSKYLLALSENNNPALFGEAEQIFKQAIEISKIPATIEYANFLYLRSRYNEAFDVIRPILTIGLLDTDITMLQINDNGVIYHLVEKLMVIPELKAAFPPEMDFSMFVGFPGFFPTNSIFVHRYIYAYALGIKVAQEINETRLVSEYLAKLTPILRSYPHPICCELLKSLEAVVVKPLATTIISAVTSYLFFPPEVSDETRVTSTNVDQDKDRPNPP